MRTPTAEKLIRMQEKGPIRTNLLNRIIAMEDIGVANPSLVLEAFSYLARTSHWKDFFLTDGLIEEDETLFSRVG